MSIVVGPSRRLVAVLIFAHALALVTVATLTLPIPVRAGLGAPVLVSLLLVLRDWHSQSALQLYLGAKGELEIEQKLGARETAELLPETALFPWIILLAWRSDGKRHARVLLADSFERDDLRRLRVWLDWRASVGFRPTSA